MIKERFPEFTERIGIKLGILFAGIPISPNMWTALSVIPAIFGFIALVYKQLLLGVVLFGFSALLDAIDGGVARVTGRTTNLGAYLDGIADRIVEALLLFGLLFYGIDDFLLPGYAWLMLLIFSGTTMTTFARAYADHRKVITDEKILRKMGGILERAERLILIFAGMILCHFNPIYLTYSIALTAILSSITVCQRVWFVINYKP